MFDGTATCAEAHLFVTIAAAALISNGATAVDNSGLILVLKRRELQTVHYHEIDRVVFLHGGERVFAVT